MTLRCLWIARDVPFPLDSGDKIYTARMSRSLAEAGVAVTLIAHDSGEQGRIPEGWPVPIVSVQGGKVPVWRALATTQPLASAVHPTRAYKKDLGQLLQQTWDLIVLDQLGSAWALEHCLAYRRGHPGTRLMYLSHNHEATLWQGMATQSNASWFRRLALQQNAWKTRTIEHELIQHVDLVTTITEEDAALYRMDCPHVRTLALNPGYDGRKLETRCIDATTPRRVILIGSFRWAVKQENLRQFLAVADARFAASGIGLDIVGDVPAALRQSIEPGLQATTLHGFVNDISVLMNNARMAVVPEVIGGGFKLKFLDYMFMRLPIATIRDAASGLPPGLRTQMMQSDTIEQLVTDIMENIDRTERIDAMQNEAFALAGNLYRWEDRGHSLRQWLSSDIGIADQDLRIDAAGVQV